MRPCVRIVCNRTASAPRARPGVLKVESARDAVNIDHLAREEEARDPPVRLRKQSTHGIQKLVKAREEEARDPSVRQTEQKYCRTHGVQKLVKNPRPRNPYSSNDVVYV